MKDDIISYDYETSRQDVTHFTLTGAGDLLRRGLRYCIGDNYKWLPEYDNIADWLSDNKGKGLLCMGNCGRGKTVICRDILSVVFKYYLKIPYFYYEPYDLGHKIDDIRSFGKNIIIDDIGLENEAVIYGERHNSFSEVVDIAEKRGIMLILTTNMTPDEMKTKYGMRTMDRLRLLTRPVLFNGESMR